MKAAIVVAVVATLAGCAPSLQVVSYTPGIVAPRGRHELNIVGGEGKVGARQVVAREAFQMMRGGGWFRPVNRADEHVRFAVVGHHAEFSPERVPPGGEGLWVRFDVVNWSIDDVVIKETNDDGDEVEKPGRHVVVGLQVSVADEDGHVLVDERAYDEEATVEKSPLVSDDAALVDVARQALADFIDDITPDRVLASVRIDDSDTGQKVIVAAARDGKIPVALKLARKYVRKYPQNAVAHYNLGALLEAQGRFEEALAQYDKALDIQPRDYYPAARLACAQRRSAWLALYGDEADHKRPAVTASAAPDAAGEPPPAP